MSKIISFLAYAAAASALAIRDTDCTSGSVLANGRLCSTKCGLDRAGGDYAAQYSGDFQTCIDACSADEECVSAQFLVTNGYCYLKSTSNPGSDNINVNTIDCPSDVAPPIFTPTPIPTPPVADVCIPGPTVVKGRTATIECGYDHPGGDYAAEYAGSLEACENLCANDAKCLTAQYDTNTKYCYLKSSVTDAVAKANVDGIVFSTVALYSNTTVTFPKH